MYWVGVALIFVTLGVAFVYAFIRSKLCITPMMMVDDYFLMLEFVLIKMMFRPLSHNDEDK